MPVGIGSTLGSYNLFAKTIPGILFFIGLISLLPSIPQIPNQEFSFGLLTITILITAIGGFVVGQALHSVGVAAESLGYRATNFIYNKLGVLGRDYWRERTGASGHLSNIDGENRWRGWVILGQFASVILRTPIRGYCWIIGHIRAIVLPHRVWFKLRLRREFKEKDKPDGLYDWFKIACRDNLYSMEMDLVEQHEHVYRFVMSYLAIVNEGRARKFQATSSFCRSTWITLLFFSTSYTILLIMNTDAAIYDPMIQSVLDNHGYVTPLILSGWSVLFMYSTGRYKEHFTEYIVVDFYNIVAGDANKSGMTLEMDQLEIEVNNK